MYISGHGSNNLATIENISIEKEKAINFFCLLICGQKRRTLTAKLGNKFLYGTLFFLLVCMGLLHGAIVNGMKGATRFDT